MVKPLSRRTASLFTLLALLTSAVGCAAGNHGGASAPAMPASVAEPASNAVSVAGLSPSDLEANIRAARAAGKAVRYVSIQTPTGTDDYSVYSQIVRSDNGILVRTYGRIQVYRLATA